MKRVQVQATESTDAELHESRKTDWVAISRRRHAKICAEFDRRFPNRGRKQVENSSLE